MTATGGAINRTWLIKTLLKKDSCRVQKSRFSRFDYDEASVIGRIPGGRRGDDDDDDDVQLFPVRDPLAPEPE